MNSTTSGPITNHQTERKTMLRFYRYTFTLRGDRGTVKITTAARNKQAAREIIKRAERCPDSAILAIIRKPL